MKVGQRLEDAQGVHGLPVYAELDPHPEHSKEMILKTEGAGPAAGVLKSKSGGTEVRAFRALPSQLHPTLSSSRWFVPMTHDP